MTTNDNLHNNSAYSKENSLNIYNINVKKTVVYIHLNGDMQ